MFLLYLRHIICEKIKQALGNGGWAQLVHDGGTLANHR
eukprot:gene6387-5901_t